MGYVEIRWGLNHEPGPSEPDASGYEDCIYEIIKNRSGFKMQDCVTTLFVFSKNGLKQNARSPLTPFSDTDINALLHGSMHFVLHGSSNNSIFQRF